MRDRESPVRSAANLNGGSASTPAGGAASPCHRCFAACCRQNGHEFAARLQGDTEWRRFAAFAVDVPIRRDGRVVVERVLPYRDGKCQFLGPDDRCTIYEVRPLACRQFECATNFDAQGRPGEFLQRNPNVLTILQQESDRP